MSDKITHNIKDSKVLADINSLIKDLSDKHQSEDIEKDIIALFEDLVKFFLGREQDFTSLESMSKDQKELLYIEISIIIEILKNLHHDIDKQEVISIMSQKLIECFSKKSKTLTITEKQSDLSKAQQKRLKQELIRITLTKMYKSNQKKNTKDFRHVRVEEYIKDLLNNDNNLSFSANIEKKDSILQQDFRKISPNNISAKKNSSHTRAKH